MTFSSKAFLANLAAAIAMAGLCGGAAAQSKTEKTVRDTAGTLGVLQTEMDAKKKAARQLQSERFRLNPEELRDPRRCDLDRLQDSAKSGLDVWTMLVACQEVSGLSTGHGAPRGTTETFDASECKDVDDCRALVRGLRETLDQIRSQRAYQKAHPETISSGYVFEVSPRSPCAITQMACKPGSPALEDAFQDIKNYYLSVMRDREARLDAAIEKLKRQQKEAGDALDRILAR